MHDANLGAYRARARLHRPRARRAPARADRARPGWSATNGKAGYTYTNGTTGGAAYAIAIGSKLRRDAEFTFVTYRDGRPVGLQPVTVRTTGDVAVAPYIPLDLG